MPKKQNKIKPRKDVFNKRIGTLLLPIILFALLGGYLWVSNGYMQSTDGYRTWNGNALIDYGSATICLNHMYTLNPGLAIIGHRDTLNAERPWTLRWVVTGNNINVSPSSSGSYTMARLDETVYYPSGVAFTATDVSARAVLTLTVTGRSGTRSTVSKSFINGVIANCTSVGGGGSNEGHGGGAGGGEGDDGDGEGDNGTGKGKEGSGGGSLGEGPAVKSNAETPSPSPQPGPNPRPTNVATTQGPQPNPIPTQSPQGTSKEQLNLEPSPFYDGKQYEPGSDPDLLGVDTTFSVAGHQLKYGWAYLLGLITSLGIGGLYIYKRQPQVWKKLHLPFTKMK